MRSPHYASVAARLLHRVPPPAPPSAAIDQAALLTIARALSARRKRQQWKRAGAAALTVAAAGALSFGLSDLRSSSARRAAEPRVSVSVVHGSGASVVDGALHRARLHVGADVAAGSRIETTPDGEAALHLSTGTEVGVGGRALLTLQERGPEQRFVLEAGGLSAKVAKLGAGARFVVETPDAELEVRGTQFQVAVLDQAEACAPARTRLFVQEGIVEVRSSGRGVLVRAGEHWPEVCRTAAAAVRAVESPPAPAPEAGGRRAAPGVRPGVDAPVAAAAVGAAAERHRSGLVAQTELFAEASRAASRGEVAVALGKFEALVQAYPTSALAENAIAERMRLQKGAAARREAERYLRAYPGGFGSPEAKRILAKP